jgi:putative ABC transport system ATP-binding protein
MNQALVVRDLCKTYMVNKRENKVLQNIDFEIPEGEMTAVMGASGSGKTTLLYAISGMDRPSSGKVTFFGWEVAGLSPREMSNIRLTEMGFIFQQMYFLKNLSIFDNIILPAYESPLNKGAAKRKAVNERARELMRKLGIREVEGNDISEVSGGELQRACICRSLINQPKILFADEPTGALNQQHSKEVMDELNRINREGTTIMLVTHDSTVAARCDRILYIADGAIKGEYELGKFDWDVQLKEREQAVTNWLSQMGW